MTTTTRRCERCGAPFLVTRRGGPPKRFCSAPCQLAAANVRYWRRRAERKAQ